MSRVPACGHVAAAVSRVPRQRGHAMTYAAHVARQRGLAMRSPMRRDAASSLGNSMLADTDFTLRYEVSLLVFMRILIAPDKFKESLTAKQVASAIRDGFHSVFPEANFDIVPVADGGEGTAEIFLESLGGHRVEVAAHDALGRSVTASYSWIPGSELAVIDMSSASGLWRIADTERNPSRASTFGTGELMADASRTAQGI